MNRWVRYGVAVVESIIPGCRAAAAAATARVENGDSDSRGRDSIGGFHGWGGMKDGRWVMADGKVEDEGWLMADGRRDGEMGSVYTRLGYI